MSSVANPSNSISTFSIASSATCPAKLPSKPANFMYGLRIGASSAETAGMFRALLTEPVLRKSDICSAICNATFSCASIVEAPRCGVAMTPGAPNKILFVAGSSENTSKAAPATCPSSRAALRSCSDIRPPRAQFIIRTPLFIATNASALIIFFVCSVNGV